MGWQTRMQIRRDALTQWEGVIPHYLERGEMAIGTGDPGELRIGVSRQPWSESVLVNYVGLNLQPLLLLDDPSLTTGDLIAYDGGRPVSGAKQIDFETSSVSGAVVYTHATATFSTDPSVVLTNDLDGGDYKSDAFVDTEAPAFSPTYSPQFGESGTSEPYSQPAFAPSYAPTIGEN